jgi:hypothetical protein
MPGVQGAMRYHPVVSHSPLDSDLPARALPTTKSAEATEVFNNADITSVLKRKTGLEVGIDPGKSVI